MKQFFIFGLGNPGKSFAGTRHNLGVDMVERWVVHMQEKGATVSAWKTQEKYHARIGTVAHGDVSVSVVSSLLFMNESGKVFSAYLQYHPIKRESVLVLHDDLELFLGEVRHQSSGSAHGHNGMRSIHEHAGDTNVPQLRIGIGRPAGIMPVDRFVLSTFTSEEQIVLQKKEASIMEAITTIVIPDIGIS